MRVAAWKRLLRRLAPDCIVNGKLPIDAQSLLHLFDEPLPRVTEEWECLLQGYLAERGLRVDGLSHPYSDVLIAMGLWNKGRGETATGMGELWCDLLSMLN